jgi:AdoMet-dependent rRNA methyltransferase SPB1
VVLHDGAPNVGTSWVQDSYVQNELVVSALRLAVDFLRPGGIFVSKVYFNMSFLFSVIYV